MENKKKEKKRNEKSKNRKQSKKKKKRGNKKDMNERNKMISSVWVHAVLTIVAYLMPNQFLLIKQVYFKQFSLSKVHILVLFDPQIRPYQVLPLCARLVLGAMVMKGYWHSQKTIALHQPHRYIV